MELEVEQLTFNMDKGDPYLFMMLRGKKRERAGRASVLDFYLQRICFQLEDEVPKPPSLEPEGPQRGEDAENVAMGPVGVSKEIEDRVLKMKQLVGMVKRDGEPEFNVQDDDDEEKEKEEVEVIGYVNALTLDPQLFDLCSYPGLLDHIRKEEKERRAKGGPVAEAQKKN